MIEKFKNIKGILSRDEMRQIKAGSGVACVTNMQCQLSVGYHSCCWASGGFGTYLPGVCIPCN